jgi:molybdopterin-guanine dinucleotide biosynthesis protein A
VVVDGATLLQRTITACGDFKTTVVVGPSTSAVPEGVIRIREKPAFGGPVAAIAAALPLLESYSVESVLVLACDMPRVAELVAALPRLEDDVDALIPRDRGRLQPLAGIYRTNPLAAAIARGATADASMFSVLQSLTCSSFDLPDGCADDIDTPDDLAVWVTP